MSTNEEDIKKQIRLFEIKAEVLYIISKRSRKEHYLQAKTQATQEELQSVLTLLKESGFIHKQEELWKIKK